EETGLIAKELILIGEYNPYNGVTNEICRIYIADNPERGIPEPEDSEEIEIIELTQIDFINKIKTGEIWDGMTLAAWSLYTASAYFQ
ncbi:MAG: ADP-ribose pyrophosphatase, partial [Bacteroidota bacterium]|nr:ADP-ribose pyrophosphatase [Bacteroidota bacterium]